MCPTRGVANSVLLGLLSLIKLPTRALSWLDCRWTPCGLNLKEFGISKINIDWRPLHLTASFPIHHIQKAQCVQCQKAYSKVRGLPALTSTFAIFPTVHSSESRWSNFSLFTTFVTGQTYFPTRVSLTLGPCCLRPPFATQELDQASAFTNPIN